MGVNSFVPSHFRSGEEKVAGIKSELQILVGINENMKSVIFSQSRVKSHICDFEK